MRRRRIGLTAQRTKPANRLLRPLSFVPVPVIRFAVICRAWPTITSGDVSDLCQVSADGRLRGCNATERAQRRTSSLRLHRYPFIRPSMHHIAKRPQATDATTRGVNPPKKKKATKPCCDLTDPLAAREYFSSNKTACLQAAAMEQDTPMLKPGWMQHDKAAGAANIWATASSHSGKLH